MLYNWSTYNDVIAMYNGKLVLVNRLTEPKGLALPGGKLRLGDRYNFNAAKEFKEETGLDLNIFGLVERYDRAKWSPSEYIWLKFWVHFGEASGTPKDEPGKTLVTLIDFKDIEAHKSEFAFEDHYLVLKLFYLRNFVYKVPINEPDRLGLKPCENGPLPAGLERRIIVNPKEANDAKNIWTYLADSNRIGMKNICYPG